jgi:diguanylate cyclase (GGDEF)-like protein
MAEPGGGVQQVAGTGQRSWPPLGALVACLTVVGLQAAVAGLIEPHAALDTTVLVNGAVELITAFACFRTAGRFRGAERRWRLLVGVFAAGSAMASAVTAAALLTAGPSAARASPAYFLALIPYLVALAGVLSYPVDAAGDAASGDDAAPRSTYHWHVGTVLDGLLIVGSIVLLAWGAVLARLILGRGHELVVFVLALSFTVIGLILVMAVTLTMSFRRPRSPTVLALLGAGLVINAVIGLATVYAAVLHARAFSPWHMTAFSATYGLIFLSTLVPARAGLAAGGSVAPSRRSRWVHVLLPYAVLAAAGLWVLGKLTTGGRIDKVETYGLAVLLLVAFVRQLVTLAANFRLLDEVREREQEVRYQAFHDQLTGLVNRTLFNRRLQRALTDNPTGIGSAERGTPISVLFVDLDNFKEVNDSYGHAAGDDLLRICAQRLRAGTRAVDTVARLGGDEFAVLLDGGDLDTVRGIGERLAAGIQAPCLLAGRPYTPHASLGLVAGTTRGATRTASPEVLLHEADMAMYAAKRLQAGTLVVFQPDRVVKAKLDPGRR